MRAHRLALLSLALAGGLFGQSTVSAPIVFTRSANFGPVGVGSTETLQVTVLNNATNILPLASLIATPGPCAGSVSLFDASGKQIGSAASFSVAAGDMQSLKFGFGQLATSGSRVELRGTISITPSTPAFCPLSYAVETFDTSSGSTHLYFNGVVTGFPLALTAGRGTP